MFGAFGFSFLSILLIVLPGVASATNNDPFRGGREAVNPKPSIGVSQSSGAMTYSYPLVLPPGRNGMQPDLSFTYSSADKRQDSVFGYGWTLNLPYIEHVNKLGTNKFYNQDSDHTFFTSSLSGEILPVKSTVPIGGGFLATSETTAPLSTIALPEEMSPFSLDTTTDTANAAPASVPPQVSDAVARSFHTFQNTFLPRTPFHPNDAAEFAAAHAQATIDSRTPRGGFEVAQGKTDVTLSAIPTELINERTATSKKFISRSGTDTLYTYRMFAIPVHYKNPETNNFDDIDSHLVSGDDAFSVDKAPYHARLSKKDADALITFSHDGATFTIDTPLAQNGKRASAMSADRAKIVNPQIPQNDHRVMYPDLLGSGINLDVTTLNDRLIKEVVIQNRGALGDLSGKDYFEIPFDVTSSEPVTLTSDGNTLASGTPMTSSSTVVITGASGAVTYIFPPQMSDANDLHAPIDIVYTVTSTGFRMVKRLPVSLLDHANYPVRADATYSVNPAVGDGTVYNIDTTWALAHDTMTGSNRGSLPDGWYFSLEIDQTSTTDYRIHRGFLPFNTSVIPDDATIATATLNIWPAGRSLHGDSHDFLAVVGPTTQQSMTWLYGSDYASDGATTSPTELSGTHAVSSTYWPDTATTSFAFPLNATGLSTISKTGYTKLGVREGHDIDNVAPPSQATRYWSFTASENANGEGLPYLEVITLATGPTAPTNLQVESLTNPSNISTSSPRFSAIHANASTTALATSYEIQVSTSASSWSSLYWDSGMQTLSSSTPSGQRSPQIFSTTTFPTDGKTYYWRIKFWDQTGQEGAWSTTGDYFVMQITGDYMAKVDDGSFMKYTLQSDGSWIAYDKRGWKYTFGATTNGRIYNSATTSEIYRWYLEEVSDPNGNKVLYRYQKDGGQVYPNYIDYTDHTGGPLVDVDFTEDFCSTGTSPCAPFATSSIYGFPVFTRYLVSDITTSVGALGAGLVHRFTPTYATGDNQSRLVLSSIKETGYADGSGGFGASALSYPTTTFRYQTSTTTWTQVTDANSYQIGFDITNSTNDDKGYRLFDVNGDGLPDWVKSDGTSQSVVFNTGNKWGSASSTWSVPLPFSVSNAEQGVREADVNGDGLTDLIAASSTKVVYLNNGTTGWTASTSLVFPESFIDTSNRDQGVQIVDLNGDGLPDVFRSYYASTTGTSSAVYINNGFGWTQDTGWSIPEVLINDMKDSAVRIYDFNGDGLPDIVYSPYPNSGAGGQPTRVYYNTGRGWAQDYTVTASPEFAEIAASIGSADRGVRFADFNGDSCVDTAQSMTSLPITVALSACGGHGSGVSVANTIPEYFRDSASDYGVRMDDVNGDGQLDIVRGYDTGTTTIRKVYLKNGDSPDLLKEVVNSHGGKTTVAYQSSARYFDTSGNLANPSTPFVVQTAHTVTTDSGAFLSGVARVIATTTYDYQRGYYYASFADQYSRQFTGFGLVIEAKPNGAGTKTYFHQGNSSDSTSGEYNDSISKAGKPYRIEVLDGTTTSANLYSRTINKWGRADYGDGRNFVKLGTTLTQVFDGDSSHRDTAASSTYDDMTGNLSEQDSLGEVLGNSDGTWTDTGSDNATTTYSYAASSTNAVIQLPSRVLVQDQSGATVKDNKFYYDNLALGSVSTGNQTKQESLISGSTYASTTKTYDAYGNIATSTDPRGNATAFIYDGYNLFPTTITNALGQQKLISYDYSSGKPATTTDENNQTVATVFDVLDRPIMEKQPDFNTPSTLVTKATYAYTDSTTTASSVFKSSYVSAATTSDSYAYTDGLGRTIQSKKEAESANGWVVNDTIYNQIGAVASTSLPYFVASSAWASATTTASLYANSYYDPMGRVATTTDNVGTTKTAYSDWMTRITDPLTNKKDYWKDAYGNLINVVEYPSGSPATTTYTWNRLGKMTKLTDSVGNIRNFTYDNLGRLLTSEDLHTSADTTFGTTTNTYDVAGNVTTVLNPRNQTINYIYDALNRVTSEDYTGAAGTEASYTYDTCTNGKGRLCQAVKLNSATTTYTYNPIGLTLTDTKKVGTSSPSTGTTTYAYYLNGSYDSITYPDSAIATYRYDEAGLLDALYNKESGAATTTVLSSIGYAPQGAMNVIAYGNGVTSTSTYDATKNYRLTNKLTQKSGNAALQNIAYTYDLAGNITTLDDQASSTGRKTINYTYDNLYRLTNASTTQVATGTSQYSESYTYDNLGNLLTKGANAYTYAGTNYANPDAATAIGGVNYAYDNAGNVTQYGSTANTWNYDNTITQVAIPGSSVATSTITFDASSTSITTTTNAGPVTKTWTQACNSCSLIVLNADILQTVGGVGYITAATDNGASFTLIASTTKVNAETEAWYFVATSTGNQNISVTVTGSTGAIKMSTASFKNTNPYSPLEGSATSSGSSGSPTINRTTTNTNDVIVATLSRSAITAATTNRTSIYNNAVTNLGASSYQIVSATGTYSDTYTGAANKNWSMIIASFKPATTTVISTSTITSLYDQSGNRVYLQDNSTSTTYLGSIYQQTGTGYKKTKHLYANGLLVETIEKIGSATATPYFIATDHLGGTNVITDTNGTATETIDYMPYGSARLDQQVGGYSENKKYIGQNYDSQSQLSYLNARYYNGSTGQFVSEDPILQGSPDAKILINPQALNFYAYSSGNPINNSDPTGLFTRAGVVEKGDTTNSIAAQLNSWYSSQYGTMFSGSALQTFNGGKSPVVGSNYAYSIDTQTGACGGCSGSLNGMSSIQRYGVSQVVDIVNNYYTAANPYNSAGQRAGAGIMGVVGIAGMLPVGPGPEAKFTVYVARDAEGIVNYVGMTSNFLRREAEHARDLGRKIEQIGQLPPLLRNQARGVEQALIERYGLSNLENKINSISTSNPIYNGAVNFGNNLLNKIGF